MSSSRESGVSALQILRALRRHKIKAGMAFLVTIGIAVSIWLLFPRQYMSEGHLFVRLGRGTVSLDPTSTTGQTISVQESRETEIRSITQVLNSRHIAEIVVDRVGVEQILESPWPDWFDVGIPGKSTSSGIVDPNAPYSSQELAELKKREKAVRKLMSQLAIGAGSKSTVISVRSKAYSPFLAQEIAQAVMDVYLNEHVRIHQTEGSLAFFKSEFQQQEQRVKQASSALRDFKNQHQVLSIEGKRKSLQDQIDTLDLSLIENESGLSAARARVETLRKEIDRFPEVLVTDQTSGIESEAASRMRDRLYNLELEYRQALANRTPEHPVVVALKQQLDDAKEILAAFPEERTTTTQGDHPARRELEIEWSKEKAASDALAALVTDLRGKRDGVLARLQQLNNDEVQLAELQRNMDVASLDYDTYAKKRSEAMILDRLDAEQISNVTIAQPASLVLKHTSPKGSIVLALGAVLGVLASTLVALIADRPSSGSTSREEIEQVLDVPVLMSIPRTDSPDVRLVPSGDES